MEFQIKVAASASTMEIIEEVIENKLKVSVNPTNVQVILEIDGETGTGSSCAALQSIMV